MEKRNGFLDTRTARNRGREMSEIASPHAHTNVWHR